MTEGGGLGTPVIKSGNPVVSGVVLSVPDFCSVVIFAAILLTEALICLSVAGS